MPEVRMLQDYQGQYSGPHFWQRDAVVGVDASTAASLVADGRAEYVQRDRVDDTLPRVGNDYRSMTVAMLRDELESRGLSTSGKKAELAKRLENNI